MHLLFIVYFPLMLSVTILSSALPRYSPLRPISKSTLKSEPDAVPTIIPQLGIGFDLTLDYGTASIQFPNGSIIDVCKLEGDDSYKALMSRLMYDATDDPHDLGFERVYGRDDYLPPALDESQVDCVDGEIEPRPARPNWDAKLEAEGDPRRAEHDARILGEQLYWLRVTVETKLGHAISSVAVSLPSAIRLPYKTLTRAVESVGLLELKTDAGPLTTATAAMVTLDREISGEHDHRNLSSGGLLVVEWTRTALVTTLTRSPGAGAVTSIDRELGHTAVVEMPMEKTSEAHMRWEWVMEAIARLPSHFQKEQSVIDVMLVGEHAGNGGLAEEVRRALQHSDQEASGLGPAFSTSRSWNSVYAASRGACQVASQVMLQQMVEKEEKSWWAKQREAVEEAMKELR